jgi:hypothetical protein
MLCLAVDAPIRCSLWPYISQSKVKCILVFMTCLASETEISTEYKNKIKFLITKLNKALNWGPDIMHILLELVLNCWVSFPAPHILNECHYLVQWIRQCNLCIRSNCYDPVIHFLEISNVNSSEPDISVIISFLSILN